MVHEKVLTNFLIWRMIPLYFLSGILISVLDMVILNLVDPNNETFFVTFSDLLILSLLWPFFVLFLMSEWFRSDNIASHIKVIIIILDLIIPVLSYFIVRVIHLPHDKQVERMGFPDSIRKGRYEKFLEIERLGFKNYHQYLEAKKRGAENYIQFQVTEKYGVDSYPLAYKIASGKFPDYNTFKKASEEGYSFYDEWREKEESKAKLVKIMKRAESIHRDDFMALMKFSDSEKFMEWIVSLPERNPFVISGDLVKFRIRKVGITEDIINATLCFTKNPTMWDQISEQKAVVDTGDLKDLSDEQNLLIMDLLNKKALPITQLMSVFKKGEFEIGSTLLTFLPQGEWLTRIEDLFRLVRPSPFCQICQQTTSDVPYFQCRSCGKYLCQSHYNDINKIGHPVCPSCEGTLLTAPISCKGCNITFLDVTNLKNLEVCQFCNYSLIYPDISRVKGSTLTNDQVKDVIQTQRGSKSIEKDRES